MRFFTFFVIACTTFISTNAVSTENLDSKDPKSTEECSTALNASLKSVSLSLSKLDSSNLEPVDDISAEAIIKIIQNEKTDLAAGFQNVPLMCCKAHSPGSSNARISEDDIVALVGAYQDYLLSFKSKKVSLSKNPKVLNVVKDLLKSIDSDLSKFISCVSDIYIGTSYQLALKDMGAYFDGITNDVVNYFTT